MKLARRFSASEHTLFRWRGEFLAGEAALASGKGRKDPAADCTMIQTRLPSGTHLRRAGVGPINLPCEAWLARIAYDYSSSPTSHYSILSPRLRGPPIKLAHFLSEE